MSNYRAPALNPTTGRVENADFVDNYFARHEYAVKFDDGQIARPWEVDILAAGQLIDRLREALEDLVGDAKRQMANPSHHIPFSLPKAEAVLAGPSTLSTKVRDE